MKIRVTLTLKKEVVEDIDNRRGLIPRSSFIENQLLQGVKIHDE